MSKQQQSVKCVVFLFSLTLYKERTGMPLQLYDYFQTYKQQGTSIKTHSFPVAPY